MLDLADCNLAIVSTLRRVYADRSDSVTADLRLNLAIYPMARGSELNLSVVREPARFISGWVFLHQLEENVVVVVVDVVASFARRIFWITVRYPRLVEAKP